MSIVRLGRSMAWVGAACAVTLFASAQEMTERFIPIGESPGVSNETSIIGEIVAVDTSRRTLTVEAEGERRTLQVNNATRIWLDRSSVGRTNETASYADCDVGRRAEVNYGEPGNRTAEWIKLAPN